MLNRPVGVENPLDFKYDIFEWLLTLWDKILCVIIGHNFNVHTVANMEDVDGCKRQVKFKVCSRCFRMEQV